MTCKPCKEKKKEKGKKPKKGSVVLKPKVRAGGETSVAS